MKKGSFPDKYKPVETKASHWTAPGIAIIAGWLMMMVVGAYFADEIRIHAEDSTDKSAKPTLVIGKAFQDIANQTGLSTIKNEIEPIIHKLYDAEMHFGSPQPLKPVIETIELKGETDALVTCGEACQMENKRTSQSIAKVLIVGSSSMRHELGRHLEKRLETTSNLLVHRHAKVGTGLARPDVYNWPKITRELIAKHQPQLVIAQFIGNDCQALINVDKSIVARKHDAHWPDAYKSRIVKFISEVQAQGTELALVGMPTVRSGIFRKRLARANKIVENAAQENGASFVPIWELSLDENGRYREEMRINGQTKPFRQSDGIHFSRDGARYVADGIHESVVERFGERFTVATATVP